MLGYPTQHNRANLTPETACVIIVAGFLMLAAILCLACGLILDTLVKNARQEFELYLNMFQILQGSETDGHRIFNASNKSNNW